MSHSTECSGHYKTVCSAFIYFGRCSLNAPCGRLPINAAKEGLQTIESQLSFSGSSPVVQARFWDEAGSINTLLLSVETFCLPIRIKEQNMLLYYIETAVNSGSVGSKKC